jgi:hypothetical protein
MRSKYNSMNPLFRKGRKNETWLSELLKIRSQVSAPRIKVGIID